MHRFAAFIPTFTSVMVILVCAGCYQSHRATPDGMLGAGADAGASDGGVRDGGVDAGRDAGADGGVDGGDHDAGAPALCGPDGDTRFPLSSRACEYNWQCFAAAHQVDCCGSLHWVGVNGDHLHEFAVQEAVCRALVSTCECGVRPPELEDGTVFDGSYAIRAGCVAGVCLSTAGRADGHPCDLGAGRCAAGLSCCRPDRGGLLCAPTSACPPTP